MRDVIELVVTLGDTTLEHRFVELAKLRVADLEIEPPSGTDWQHFKSGLIDVAVRRAEPPKKHALAGTVGDRRSAGYVAISLAAHLLVWGVAYEPEAVTVKVDPPIQIGARIASTYPVIGAALDSEIGDVDDPLDGGGRPSMGLTEQASGATANDQGPGAARRGERAAVITRAEAIERARASGILGSVTLQAGGHVGGFTDLSAGFDDVSGIVTSGQGGFGFGRSHVGPGGSGDGLLAAGRYHTIGSGRGTGEQSHGLAPRGPTIIPCGGPGPCMFATGGLDKSIIRRYIRRELPKIQFCYERALLANDKLSGEVDTHFLIQVDGHVSLSQASGMSAEITNCVAGVIKNIVFPRSPDGISEVRYPFTFRTAGS